jgi:signal transduction histidine kinase
MRGVTTVVDAASAPTAPRRDTSAIAGFLATATAAVTILVSALAVAGDDDPWSVVGRRALAWLLLVELAAVVVMVAGVWAVRGPHPRVSTALAVGTTGSLLPLWAGWPWLPGPARGGVLAAAPLTVAGVARVALQWPTRPSRGAGGAGRAVTLLATAAGLVHLLGYNPFADPGCARVCDDVRPLVENVLTTRSAVASTCLLSFVAAVVAATAVLRARAPRAPRSVSGAVVFALAALAVLSAVRWASWADPARLEPLLAFELLVVAVVGAVVCGVTIRTARTRAAIDRLGLQLSDPATAMREVSGAIRGVQFALPGEARWVDAAGRDVHNPPARGSYVVLSDGSGPVLRLLLARRADQGEVLAGLTPATRLALHNAELAAVATARLAEVQASQRRVVALSDAERRRIERDLHDGAQQRLVSVAFHLGAAMAGIDPAAATRLASPYARVRGALAQLRELAHGIFPGVLVNEGLTAALDELVTASDVPATLDIRVDKVVDAIAMAAYATVVAALDGVERPSSATRAQISVVQDGGTLTVRVEVAAGGANVVAPDVTDAADRVGALGGHLTVSDAAEVGMVVTAVIPCGS